MSKVFEGPPTREEIPILRGQVFSKIEVEEAIFATADAIVETYDGKPVVFIQVNQGAKFFARGLKNAMTTLNPNLRPVDYPIRVTRTNTDSSFRQPVVVEGLPEGLDLSEVRTAVKEDIVDEGRTLIETIIPLLKSHGAEDKMIDIWTMLRRKRRPELEFPVSVFSAMEIDSDGFVFGSGIDDNRLAQYERYRLDAGRGEAGIWENDPIVPES